MSKRLAIHCFGTFFVTLAETEVTGFESDKARALLAYLAVAAGQPHRRERLAGLLWPDFADQAARTNLRRVLSNVRQVIGDRDNHTPFLLVTPQSIQFDAGQDYWLDVAEFVRGVAGKNGRSPAIHELEQAIALHNGPFLAGFSLPDSDPFEEWLRLTGETLQQQAAAALHQLASHYESQGDYAAGLSHARRWLELDPFAEAAHRQLMRLLALSGQRSEALAHYETCRQLLADELGLEPEAETQALVDRIRSGEWSPEVASGAMRPSIRGYELRQQLGRGNYGSVYRAYQPIIGRDVAIKVILPQYANQPDFIRRFEVEAQLVARLEHPHIVPLYDYWREPDGAYLVMRWLRAGSLHDALQRGPWHLETAVRLINQIATALTAAHRQGVVHRDIKPANILLDEENNAYLSDFGIALLLEPFIGALVSAGQPVELPMDEGLTGTPEYISPEIVQRAAVTPQADIYSLGVVLYELLTGQHPFPHLTLAALLERHLYHPLPLVHSQRPDLPLAVDDVIQTATAKDPNGRYPDARSLAKAFRQAAQTGGIYTPPALPLTDADLPNPYLGLRPFQEADAANFFGRDSLIKALVERVGDARFLTIIGPSGSGKSSAVKAGLIPALRDGALPGSDNWFITQMTPGTRPLEELETALLRVAVNPPPSLLAQLQDGRRGLLRAVRRALPDDASELLLLIDQFEELFTQTTDEAARTFFLDSLTAAVSDSHSRLRLVITLRADFYDRPLQYADFGHLVRAHQETVLPLATGELAAAITGPATRTGLSLESGLAAAMIADLQQQPGALPLLQYALAELVEQRRDSILTLADYANMGGIAGALSRRAENLFANLDETEQAAIRHLFLRLVALGEDEAITRRRAAYAELLALMPERESVISVIEQYGRYRLLTFDHDPASRAPTVEVAHEALLLAWPRLRQWLDEGRTDLRLQRLLTNATTEWQQTSRNPGFLLRRAHLDQFAAWAESSHLPLTPAEQEFLEASLAARREREAAEAARQRHEAALERRSWQRLQALVAVLLVATAVAVGLTLVAFNQSRLAQAQTRQATARELAAAAISNINVDPERSVLLAMYGISETVKVGETAVPEAVDALHQAIVQLRHQHTLPNTGSAACLGGFWCSDMAFTPDGQFILTTGVEGHAVVWEAGTGRKLLTLSGHAGPVIGVALNPAGTHAATANADGTAALWPIAELLAAGQSETPAPSLTFTSHGGEVVAVAFSPDGTRLATASLDQTARVWDVTSGGLLLTLAGHEESVRDVAFTPDGDFLVTGSSDRTARIWNLATGEVAAVLAGHTDRVFDISLSPDGTLLATASRDSTVKLWHLAWAGEGVTASEQMTAVTAGSHGGPVWGTAFSPDGRLLATGGADAAVQVWSMANGQRLLALAGHSSTVVNLAFSPDGHTLASGSLDGTVRMWDITPEGSREWLTLAEHQAVSFDVNYSPDGRLLATASFDGTAVIWDATSGKRLYTLATSSAPVSAAVFSPDGQRLATASFDGTAVVWNVASGEQLFVLAGHQGPVQDIAFQANGSLLATAGADGTVRLWDAASGQDMHVFAEHERGVERVVFSPDGRLLVSVGVDGTARLFDVANLAQIGVLAGHEGSVLGVAFNNAGSRLATTGLDRLVLLWDVADLAQPQPLLTLTGHQGDVWGVAFSPDDQTLATISSDGTARLWDIGGEDLANRQVLALGPGNDGREVAFSPDGRFLATTSSSGLVRVYLTSTAELMSLAQSRLSRSLTEAECRQYLRLSPCPAGP
jgi:WD40 repeat protein/serine/threonine protein kinase/DNA-binding SARP family transcriptional activator